MPVIGGFSTDYSSEPVIDPDQSRIQGQPVFVPGKKQISCGGTWNQRGVMPLTELGQHGDWETVLSWQFRTLPDGHVELMQRDGTWVAPDIWTSQRWMSRDAKEQFLRARAAGIKVVAELDDDFWSLGKTNVAFHTTDPKNNPDFNRDHYWESLKVCDAITVSTEALRKRVERLGVPTFVLRNAIDITIWPQNDPGDEERWISWLGGIQWRSHDLAQLKCAGLPAWLRSHELGMYHGGNSQVPGVPKFYEQIGIDPTVTPCPMADLCPIWEYPKLWLPVSISLIPLEKVHFNLAKSWLKSLESCAVGVPYIVSAGFHEQNLLIAEGTAGRVARNDKPRQWLEHLEDLIDPELRRKEGAINRAIAEKHDIRIKWTEWDAAYKEIVNL